MLPPMHSDAAIRSSDANDGTVVQIRRAGAGGTVTDATGAVDTGGARRAARGSQSTQADPNDGDCPRYDVFSNALKIKIALNHQGKITTKMFFHRSRLY